jgi:signal transduction histidine kinase
MYADLTKTRQILLNLLSNATKFTQDGTITVHIRRRDVDFSSWMEFEVSDTGVGMTAEQSRRIFDAFTQADVTTRQYGGTGLGLTIVSRFCALMGGSVTVDSVPAGGSTFLVRLPVEVVDMQPQSLVAGVA